MRARSKTFANIHILDDILDGRPLDRLSANTHPFGREPLATRRQAAMSELATTTLPQNTGSGYVAAAYIVFFAIVLIYVAIMAVRLGRMERRLRELRGEGEHRGARDEPGAGAERERELSAERERGPGAERERGPGAERERETV